MKEEDQHTKIPSPHRILSLNPHTPPSTHTLSHINHICNKHAYDTLVSSMKTYHIIVFSVGSVFILN